MNDNADTKQRLVAAMENIIVSVLKDNVAAMSAQEVSGIAWLKASGLGFGFRVRCRRSEWHCLSEGVRVRVRV